MVAASVRLLLRRTESEAPLVLILSALEDLRRRASIERMFVCAGGGA